MIAEYEALLKGNVTDEVLAREARTADDGTRYPAILVNRILAGQNPVKVFREGKNLTQEDLASACCMTKNFISMIETGRRPLMSKTAAKIAAVLDVDEDMLTAISQRSRSVW